LNIGLHKEVTLIFIYIKFLTGNGYVERMVSRPEFAVNGISDTAGTVFGVGGGGGCKLSVYVFTMLNDFVLSILALLSWKLNARFHRLLSNI
jgi:hypothetical protein